MFADMAINPRQRDPAYLEYSHIQFLIGYVDVYSRKPEEALRAFENSLASRSGASHAMAMAALMASNGFNREALVLSDKALEYMRDEAAGGDLVQAVKESDIIEFQKTVRADLETSTDAGTSDPVH